MQMVNAVPGYYVAGENGGVMNIFMQMNATRMYYGDSVFEEHVVHDVHNVGGEAWNHKPISQRKVRTAVREYITAIIGETDRSRIHTIGFKEIRHWNRDQLDEFLNVFPKARFIINTRTDVKALALSHHRFFKKRKNSEKSNIESNLRQMSELLEKWASDHPDNSFLIRLEDFNLGKFNQMLKWLGEDQCKFIHIATENTVNGWGARSQEKLIQCGE
jgi:hypothetical protein